MVGLFVEYKSIERTRTCLKFAEKQSVTGVRPSQFPTSLFNIVESSQREGLWLKSILIGQLSYTIRAREREHLFIDHVVMFDRYK